MMVTEQAAVAAATAIAPAATAAAAAVVAKGVRLRLETDQDDGHGRQSQYHLQYIAFHQNTSKHMDKKWDDQPFANCAMDDQRGPAIVLA